ncbi:hypothetical protein VPHG_00164 [Vibrio phage 11895-B1]|uniref:hypothetical protein n=1 Tax=Vibrio phage 11895-B1 TaxID=754075 RepID=UPI0002C1471F|nr:hypothetical protein VPHG_00164 [Vibrio phage 11895-B1]AGH32227.1 hypothetical protein VPHG_00164 [Vibrio phage 11895-B1]
MNFGFTILFAAQLMLGLSVLFGVNHTDTDRPIDKVVVTLLWLYLALDSFGKIYP